MKKDKQFVEQIIRTFPDRLTKDCFSISMEDDYIQDDEKSQRCFFTGGKETGFEIINLSKKEINLFSTDGCFFTDTDKKRSDGIVFDDKELCFFELRLNVISKREKTKQDKFKEAIEKLEFTIDFFKENNFDFLSYKQEAFVCMNENSYPYKKASRQARIVAFLQKNKIQLFDKNIKEFK